MTAAMLGRFATLIGVEVLVGRHVGDFDQEDVVVVADHVARVAHFGQFGDGAFEREDVCPCVAHEPDADQDAQAPADCSGRITAR